MIAPERKYPWGGDVPTTVQDGEVELGVYSCMADGSGPGDCASTDILPVGSKPAGAGLFGQLDLGGSLTEWVLDFYALHPSTAMSNYAYLESSFTRVYRGGAFNFGPPQMEARDRTSVGPSVGSGYAGVRCARK